jgi:hypothetical protein
LGDAGVDLPVLTIPQNPIFVSNQRMNLLRANEYLTPWKSPKLILISNPLPATFFLSDLTVRMGYTYLISSDSQANRTLIKLKWKL